MWVFCCLLAIHGRLKGGISPKHALMLSGDPLGQPAVDKVNYLFTLDFNDRNFQAQGFGAVFYQRQLQGRACAAWGPH